jgi:hypothetical protein
MEVCIAEMRGKPVMFALHDGVVFLDGKPQPVKYVTEEEVEKFIASVASMASLSEKDAQGVQALLNAKRAAFVVSLLGRAVGDECVTELTRILDHLHYDVLLYLGEVEEPD